MARKRNPETEKRYEKKVKDLLKELPPYVGAYNTALSEKLAAYTRYTYLLDLRSFLSWITKNDPSYGIFPVNELPIYAVTDRTEDDIRHFLESLLSGEKPAADTFKRRNATSLSSFYRFLCEARYTKKNPAAGISFRRTLERTSPYITEEDCQTLIDGIRGNDLYLVSYKTPDGAPRFYVDRISERGRILREKQISRNVLIFSLFLYTGMTEQEIAGINLSDIDHLNNAIYAGPERRRMIYGKEVRTALSSYLHGEKVPEDLLLRQTDPAPADFLSFCRHYMDDPDIGKIAERRFHRSDPAFLSDIRKCARILRAGGRTALSPKEGEDALLLSSRGKRMSVRMIQHMIKELSRTYLPNKSGDEGLTATALRKVREANLLRESDQPDYIAENMGIQDAWAKQKISAYDRS